MTNVYLTYYKTVVRDGLNFYYLKGVFLPTTFSADVLLYLLKLLGEDLHDFFDIETATPDFIAQGTDVYSIGGGTWQAPCDLYKYVVYDFPSVIAGFSDPLSVDDLIGRIPYVVYAESPPNTTSSVPAEFDAPLATAKTVENPLVLPENVSYRNIIVASKHTNTPFWTHVNMSYIDVWAGCNYSQEPAHQINRWGYNEYYEVVDEQLWTQDVYHSNLIDSCNNTYRGSSLVYSGSNNYYSLEFTEYYTVQPVYYFAPSLLFPIAAPSFQIPIFSYILPLLPPSGSVDHYSFLRGVLTGHGIKEPLLVNGEPLLVNGESLSMR